MKPTNFNATQGKREPVIESKCQNTHVYEPCILKTWLSRRQWLLKPVLHR